MDVRMDVELEMEVEIDVDVQLLNVYVCTYRCCVFAIEDECRI
jgi:hypothetical protein